MLVEWTNREKQFGYDIESYPNFFSCVIKNRATGTRWIFEISDWINNAPQLIQSLNYLSMTKSCMIGFNNCGYDYQVLHHLMMIGETFTAADAFQKTDFLINADRDEVFRQTIWPSNYLIPQIDLYRIHHFDNQARRTSLKAVEFAMRSSNVGDLPVAPGEFIRESDRRDVIVYNCHDVDETLNFVDHSESQIEFRASLMDRIHGDVMNFNDTKIGKQFFIQKLEEMAPGICGKGRDLRQTHRRAIAFNDVIFPYVRFETQEFAGVLNYLKSTTITSTKKVPELDGLSVTLKGFQFDFGTGGIHGSVKESIIKPDDNHELIDIDVTSYYPTLAIANRVYPAHLSEMFCDIYEDLFESRKQFAKGTVENGMLKLALNGVYGDSNNVYSPFYDPQYTMTITINGQLLLCMLAEQIMLKTNGKLVQINTDGLTVLISKHEKPMLSAICEWWQSFTRLALESVNYDGMWIRDVNNYIARGVDGKIKRKGAYEYHKLEWHKDHSSLIVQKAAEQAMLSGVAVEHTVNDCSDPFDFCIRAKATGKSYLETTDGVRRQKLTRFHIAHTGPNLYKIMPPLPAKPDEDRRIGICVGHAVNVCDRISDFDWSNLNRDWYIKEANKLVIS